MSKAAYRFKLPFTDPDTTYRFEWEEVTTYAAEEGGSEPDIRQLWEDVQGNGEESLGKLHAMPPLAVRDGSARFEVPQRHLAAVASLGVLPSLRL